MVFHVLNRGVAGLQLFEKAGDYQAFEWQKRIAKRLGLESAYRSRGRPSIVYRSAEAADAQ
jgi:hypothetical protein